MFNSIRNNFGAGTIRFKSYQAENYVVLNAKFSFLTASQDYQAADVLEITVPTLSIDRSVEVAVYVCFHDRRQFFGCGRYYDGCTIARSWIKDANTICIEKLACMEGKEKLYVYIAAFYPQLNQGVSAQKQTSTPLALTPAPLCSPLGNPSFAVVYEHWVFLYIKCGSVPGGIIDEPWEGIFDNLPLDVQAELPFCGGTQQYNNEFTGMSEILIKDGKFFSRYRCSYPETPFCFAFLVRGDSQGEVLEEWPLAAEEERARQLIQREHTSQYEGMLDLSFELGQGSLFVSILGRFEATSPEGTIPYTPDVKPKVIPSGRFSLVCRSKAGAGLAIYDFFGAGGFDNSSRYYNFCCSAARDQEMEIFDTGLYTYEYL